MSDAMPGSASRHQPEKVRRSFWEDTGENFPSLAGAPSTRYYLACEQGLFERFAPDLSGKSIFKTDLWDEAKNTRILRWVADRGADVFGLDISLAIVRQAREAFRGSTARRGFIGGDLRRAGFRSGVFDVIYSMGTIEHFPEYRAAVAECFRVLKPGGTAIIGVPYKHDVFLRPLLVAALGRLGLYSYGEEKAFGMAEFENVLRGAGFEIRGRSGILFIPGWLRMLDLWLYVRRPWTRRFMAPLIAPFGLLYRASALVRRQGYLVVCAVRKPSRLPRF
jgi:SAM-dependent methyltransferase